jgi:hypothetical protein
MILRRRDDIIKRAHCAHQTKNVSHEYETRVKNSIFVSGWRRKKAARRLYIFWAAAG